MDRLKSILCGLVCLLFLTQHAAAEDNPPWYQQLDSLYFQTSLYTTHFDPKPEHNNNQDLLNLEFRFDNQVLLGGAWFRTSFGQPSWYWYGGYRWFVPQTEQHVYFSLSAGLLHGYDGEYADRIDFNSSGIAPAALPALGFEYAGVNTQIILFGTAGLMLSLGYEFEM